MTGPGVASGLCALSVIKDRPKGLRALVVRELPTDLMSCKTLKSPRIGGW